MKHVSTYWHKVRRPLAAVAVGGVLAISLQGCFLMAGTAIVGGTMAAVDRRTLGAQTEDKTILVKGTARIPDVVSAGSHVNVTSFNRQVLLSGEVPDAKSKAAAEAAIKEIEGVVGVFNELEIAGAAGFGSRSNDTLITSKVVASLMDADNISAHVVKVTTERGIVYLMGRVTQEEGTLAARIASGVSGVQRVVTLYEYISEAERKELDRNNGTPQQGTTHTSA